MSSAEVRLALVHALLARFPGSIAILHGSASCLVGLFGGRDSVRYHARIPDFKSLRERLQSIALGSAEEADVQ